MQQCLNVTRRRYQVPFKNVEDDLKRAKELRNLGKEAHDAGAKGDLEAAAVRLEKRAAKKARKVGRKRPAGTGSSSGGSSAGGGLLR